MSNDLNVQILVTNESYIYTEREFEDIIFESNCTAYYWIVTEK